MLEDYLPEDHNCELQRCTSYQHYGLSKYGLCLVCGGCGDPECCGSCDSDCFAPE